LRTYNIGGVITQVPSIDLKKIKTNGRIKGAIMMNNMIGSVDHYLGYIELETGPKLITPMNDVFLNYIFQNEANWEQLRTMANIFYHAYIKTHADTKIKPIEGEITVKTQFPYFKEFSSSKPKAQDMRIESAEKVDFLEFQNEMRPKIPISRRSTEYLGFSLTRGEDKQQSSMWLLNGTVLELLNGKVFSNFVLMDEQDHYRHPNESNVLYVDLKELAKTNTPAGELACILTNIVKEPKNEEVKLILQSLKQSFNAFKNDTEVRNIMTRAELLRAEGEERLLPLLDEKEKQIDEKEKEITELKARLEEQGHNALTRAEHLKEEGKAESEDRLLPLLDEKEKQIDEKEKRIAELEAMLASITT